ncbi:MAG: general secretion pathway protein GspB [Pseudomonadota bacterium]|jgi:general secretion pathway protein B|nr:general secretion pathway protein GspB [Rubrivivax sp.]MCZ8030353.1 general secretion pathway protein GspB [Rubrivivax sp.]
MSYILDALRRAQSERMRGQVPGLDAQAIPLAGEGGPAGRRRAATGMPAAGRAAALAAAMLGLAALAWWIGRGAAPSDAASPTAAVPPGPGVLQPSPAPWLPSAPLPSPPVAAVLPPAAIAAPPAPAGPPAGQDQRGAGASAAPVDGSARGTQPAAAAPATVPLHQGRSAERASAPPLSLPGVPPGVPPATAVVPAPPAAAAPVRLADLPAQQRAEMPPMAIGGAIYSDSAAARFVLINGQVVREGEGAAPGVTLERIGPRSAVLRWRDLRIEVPY